MTDLSRVSTGDLRIELDRRDEVERAADIPTTAVGSTFPTLAAFYADRPERERSPEVDFGVRWWTGGASWPQYRVSWIEKTGEFYTVNLGYSHHPEGGQVELLGTAADRDAADEALKGWADLDGYGMQLSWVRERLG